MSMSQSFCSVNDVTPELKITIKHEIKSGLYYSLYYICTTNKKH